MGIKSSSISTERYQLSPDGESGTGTFQQQTTTNGSNSSVIRPPPSFHTRNTQSSLPYRHTHPPEPPPPVPSLIFTTPTDNHRNSYTTHHPATTTRPSGTGFVDRRHNIPSQNDNNTRLPNERSSFSSSRGGPPFTNGNNNLASRPLPSIPSDQTSSDRPDPTVLDIDRLIADLNEIRMNESRRVRSSSSHHHHHRPSRQRDGYSRSERRRETDDILSDPLSFLRSITRTRQCPNCSENLQIENYEDHLSSCSKKRTIQYNEDTLTANCGECSICLDDMSCGDRIARLPCLCIYHTVCIVEWLKVKAECPQHPDLELPSA